MGFEMVKESYSGSIKEITLGKGNNAIKVGGETSLPFYSFEGELPNKPKIAMEIWDKEPQEWPEAAKEPFKDCLSDPAAWAKKCVEEYGADMIVIQLKSTDPNDDNASPADAVATVKNVVGAVDVPIAVWGTANVDKDAEVLKKIAEECDGENLLIGPIEDANHKSIGAAVMGYGHTAIASSPIDVNLAKQVNILLENLGLPLDKIVIDPTTGGLGYGMEYSYSVMERIKLAALAFGDDKLQLPIINNLANEVWRCKEANEPVEENPRLGDPERRGIMMEAVAAVNYLMAGSNILVMRHPEAIRMVRSYTDLLTEGGQAQDVKPIQKALPEAEIDYKAWSPEMDLSIEEEKKKEEPKKEEAKAEEPKAAEQPKEEAKAEAQPAQEKPKEEAKEEAKPQAEPAPAQEAAKEAPKQEAAAGSGVGLDANELKSLIKDTVQEVVKGMKQEESAEKEKAEEKSAQEKGEKKQKQSDPFAEMKKWQKEEAAKLEAEEQKLREKRKQERDKQLEKKMQEMEAQLQHTKTPAQEQKGSLEKLLDRTRQFNRVQ